MHHTFTYGIYALGSQTSFRVETSSGVKKVLAVFLSYAWYGLYIFHHSLKIVLRNVEIML